MRKFGYVRENDVTDGPRCKWCGRKLRSRSRIGGLGYLGNGYFCTASCGFEFGYSVAKTGTWLIQKQKNEQ